jgi:hypothetical protein
LAIKRAALDRQVELDAVRSPHVVPGLGVTAVTSAGEPLCVGSWDRHCGACWADHGGGLWRAHDPARYDDEVGSR